MFQDTGFAETGRSVDSINLNTIPGSRIRSSKGASLAGGSGDPPVHNELECGVTKHRAFSKRIIGGKKAKFAELPWQVNVICVSSSGHTCFYTRGTIFAENADVLS